jgi:hypothetical protein
MSGNQYITTTVRCAGTNCDHVKGDVNHWWIAELRTAPDYGMHIAPWDDEKAERMLRDWGLWPLCGCECAIKMMQEWMSDVKAQGGQSK